MREVFLVFRDCFINRLTNQMSNKKVLLSIFVTVLIDAIGYGILIPVIPRVLTDPNSSSFILKLGQEQLGYYLLGIITAIYPLMQFLSAPILGQLSDVKGRKPILALSIFGTAIGYILFASGIWFKSVTLLFLGRMIDGVTAGNFAIAQAAIADISEPQDRPKNFGLIGAAFGVGFVVGPVLGGILSDARLSSRLSVDVPFIFAAFLAIINTILVVQYFPNTNQGKQLKIAFGQSWSNIKHVIGLEREKYLFIAWFLFQAGFAFYTSFVSAYYYNVFKVTERDVGMYFGVVGVGMIITQGFILRKIVKRFEPKKIVETSLLGIAFLIALIPYLGSFNLILILAGLLAVFLGLGFANFSAIMSKLAPKNEQGEVLGIAASVQALAQTFPPLIAAFLASKFKLTDPLFASALFIVLSWWVFVKKASLKNLRAS